MIEEATSVLPTPTQDRDPKTGRFKRQVTCQRGHNIADLNSRTCQGKCKLCHRVSDLAYRERGGFYKTLRWRLNQRITHKREKALELEKELSFYDKEIGY